MPDLKAAMKLIAGREPTPEELHRIMAIAHSLDIPVHDAMFPILVELDTYHGIFSRLPGEIARKTQKSAEDAAQKAAVLAQSKVNAAVADLIPSISGQLADAAGAAVRQAQVGRSMITVWGAMLLVGLVFSAGYFSGAREFSAAQRGQFPWDVFLTDAGARIGLGLASPSLVMLGGLFFLFPDGTPSAWGWVFVVLGVASLGVLIFLALN